MPLRVAATRTARSTCEERCIHLGRIDRPDRTFRNGWIGPPGSCQLSRVPAVSQAAFDLVTAVAAMSISKADRLTAKRTRDRDEGEEVRHRRMICKVDRLYQRHDRLAAQMLRVLSTCACARSMGGGSPRRIPQTDQASGWVSGRSTPSSRHLSLRRNRGRPPRQRPAVWLG